MPFKASPGLGERHPNLRNANRVPVGARLQTANRTGDPVEEADQQKEQIDDDHERKTKPDEFGQLNAKYRKADRRHDAHVECERQYGEGELLANPARPDFPETKL